MTIEAALAISCVVVVLVIAMAGVGCVIAQLRCGDAAAEAARLAGRGDDEGAHAAVRALAPQGASLALSVEGDDVRAVVTVGALGGLLPGVTVRATATAALEEVTPP